MTSCTVHRLAEQALLYSGVAPPASLEVQRRIWAMAARAAEWRGVVDVVPGMNTLTVIFDGTADFAAPEHNMKLACASRETRNAAGRLVEIPVRYGGEHGPDLVDRRQMIAKLALGAAQTRRGLGLGPAISANIVGSFEDSLCAENRPQGGALFRVTLKGDVAKGAI